LTDILVAIVRKIHVVKTSGVFESLQSADDWCGQRFCDIWL